MNTNLDHYKNNAQIFIIKHSNNNYYCIHIKTYLFNRKIILDLKEVEIIKIRI